MDKRKAIHILTKAAALYHANLEDKKILFLYGVPAEIKKQYHTECGKLLHMKSFEVVFHRHNFLHLTGIRVHESEICSAIQFYDKCLHNRLREDDFSFARDGSTAQKLDILEHMMGIKKNATMIGEFTDRGPRLYTEKAAGNICGCVGFVEDRYTGLHVPNTLLKKDIRDVIVPPVQKVYFVLSKEYKAQKYSVLEKVDKELDIKKCFFSEKIENLLEREIWYGKRNDACGKIEKTKAQEE